jgi:para-aminobenzoate synthetase component 1
MHILDISYRDPVSMFQNFSENAQAVLLDGFAAHGERPVSILAANPVNIISVDNSGVMIDCVRSNDNPFLALRHLLQSHSRKDAVEKFPFTGGFIGALGYELGGYLEKLPAPKPDDLFLPMLIGGIYDTVALFDHQAKKSWIVSHNKSPAKAEALAKQMMQPRGLPHSDKGALWQHQQNRAEVERNIQRVIDYIYAGDIFQANYTQRFIADRPTSLSHYELFLRLRHQSPAPFGAFLRHGDLSLASASPERFLKLDANRVIMAQPIKGTRPRDADPRRDAALADELRRSVKDNAENLMIVDLMRSDIGRVAEIGSVRVPQLNTLESFSSVHHLVSTVTARLREGLDAVDLLQATFPGGSITGAPKIRAMEIIHELEPVPRGFYCGCLGWIGFDGAMDMSMTIRTLTMTRDKIVAQAGGGIVADSVPAAEYDESMVKIAPLLQTLNKEAEDNEVMAERRAGR